MSIERIHTDNSRYSDRIWELDFLRGIALVFMIYFHIIYDLSEMFDYRINYSSGVNHLIGKMSAILFIFISGVSSSISRNNLKRGFKVLFFAGAITLATWIYNPRFIIIFGILHFLGVCMILTQLFSRIKNYLLLFSGTLVIMAGVFVKRIHVPNDIYFIFGVVGEKFTSSDYYPMVPWLGIFLYGLAVGKMLYKHKKSVFRFRMKDNLISRAGRKTLLFYILHQPLIVGTIILFRQIF
ncbi:MAG: DUF1624 domain-containing protein [Clostridia bacterium]|nr:DUF1624 domain-containing protein [Clostridia bacterium]